MRDFRDRFRTGEAGVPPGERHVTFGPESHTAVAERCADVLEDHSASLETVRQALFDALDLIRGADARAVIANEEAERLRAALKESKKGRSRGGRVGGARVYEQREIEEIAQKEQERQSKKSKSKNATKGKETHHPRHRAGSSHSPLLKNASPTRCGRICTDRSHRQEAEGEASGIQSEDQDNFEVCH